MLILALVGAAVVGVTSLSLAKANSIAINSMGSNKIAMQAQQYALAKGELIRATKYTELAAQAKTNIQNSNGFQDEVVVGTESTVDSTTRKKDVTVKVYKTGETVPRSSIIVTRYNKSLDSSIPSGTILPWYGNLSNIPSGFALCNGSNGTPDLRDRFLVGAGYSYNLGNTGGANTVTLNTNQIPSHAHSRGTMEITGGGGFACDDGGAWGAFRITGRNSNTDSGGVRQQNFDFVASRTWTGVTSYVGGSQAHENRPPYFAVYYIMKL